MGRVNIEGWRTISQLTKLLLAVEPEIPNNDNELADECNPERSRSHRAPLQPLLEVPLTRIWKDAFRTNPIRGSGTSNHHTDRPDNLRKC